MLNDLENIAVDIGITMMYNLQAYKRCTSGLVATIPDLLLPVTSHNVGGMSDRFGWSSFLGITGVANWI